MELKSVLGRRWIIMSVIGVIVFVATYLGLVRTYLGQYLENAALIGAKQATTESVDGALENLHVISITSLVIMMIAFAIVGVVRKSWRVALAGMAALGGSAVLAELLKRVLLHRPDLAAIYNDNNAHNSFPSGHTTIAMAILVSLLLVTSYRWRGVVMFFSITWAVSVGSATVTARWHRFSDTLGADMLALTVGAIVAYWLLTQNAIVREEGRKYVGRVILVVFIAGSALVALVSGGLVAALTVRNFGLLDQLAAAKAAGVAPDLTAHLDPVFNENMYLAAQTLAFAFSALAALWFWGTFHRLSTASQSALALQNPDQRYQ